MWTLFRNWLVKYKVYAWLAAAAGALGSVAYVIAVFFRGKYAKPMAELEVRRQNTRLARAVRKARRAKGEDQAAERERVEAELKEGRRDHFENDW